MAVCIESVQYYTNSQRMRREKLFSEATASSKSGAGMLMKDSFIIIRIVYALLCTASGAGVVVGLVSHKH